MKCALLTLGTQAKPGAISRTDISEIEASSDLLVWTRLALCLFVAYLGMVVAHLRVLLDTESVLLVSSYCKASLINWNHSVASRSLEHVKFDHGRLRCSHHFEL